MRPVQVGVHIAPGGFLLRLLNLAVFGASGQTGRLVVEQALAQGYVVRAFARHPARLRLQNPRITQLAGDVTDAAAVTRAVTGVEAVLCTLGARNPLRSYPAFREGIRNILGAMSGAAISRFVYLSFLGVPAGRAQLRWPFTAIAPLLLPGAIADHEANEAAIRESGLEWTIVRAPKLSNGPPTGRYRSGEEIRARSRFPAIARADVAHFMLQQVAERTYVRCAPAILP